MRDDCYAIMRGECIYSLKPLPQSLRKEMKPFKWKAYKNGRPWRFFINKRDFDRDVCLEPMTEVYGPHAKLTELVEFCERMAGQRILDELDANQCKLRAQRAEDKSRDARDERRGPGPPSRADDSA